MKRIAREAQQRQQRDARRVRVREEEGVVVKGVDKGEEGVEMVAEGKIYESVGTVTKQSVICYAARK